MCLLLIESLILIKLAACVFSRASRSENVMKSVVKTPILNSPLIVISIHYHSERLLFDLMSEWVDYVVNLYKK